MSNVQRLVIYNPSRCGRQLDASFDMVLKRLIRPNY